MGLLAAYVNFSGPTISRFYVEINSLKTNSDIFCEIQAKTGAVGDKRALIALPKRQAPVVLGVFLDLLAHILLVDKQGTDLRGMCGNAILPGA